MGVSPSLAAVPPGHVAAVVTWLEMHAPPAPAPEIANGSAPEPAAVESLAPDAVGPILLG